MTSHCLAAIYESRSSSGSVSANSRDPHSLYGQIFAATTNLLRALKLLYVNTMTATDALKRIQRLVHQKTARNEPALHHFQRDFDEIRRLCDQVIGQFVREKKVQ